jgi:hypothetical protein
MATKRKTPSDSVEVHAWDKIYDTVGNIIPIVGTINQYKKTLQQIATLSRRTELETVCREGEKWDLDYVWNVTSADTIVEFVKVYWENLRKRYEDIKQMATWQDQTVEQKSRLEQMTAVILKELRRWKRIIRCDDEDMDKIEKKTLEWVRAFVKKWEETNQKYDSLEKVFVAVYHTFATSKIKTSSLKSN